MKALGKSRVVVREFLAVAPLLDTMPLRIWRPSRGLGETMISTFATLKKLRLSLDLNYNETEVQGVDEQPLASEALTKALSSATNLESLHISLLYATWGFDISKYDTDFGTLVKTCSFPKLTFMSLHRCSADEDEIMSFLKRSPAVRSLILKSFHLIGGHWTTLVQDIRDTTRVKDLDLSWIRGSIADKEGDNVEDIKIGSHGLGDVMQDLFNRQKGSRVSNTELKRMVEKRRTERLMKQLGLLPSSSHGPK